MAYVNYVREHMCGLPVVRIDSHCESAGEWV